MRTSLTGKMLAVATILVCTLGAAWAEDADKWTTIVHANQAEGLLPNGFAFEGYVSSGLITHYDAILNQGLNAERATGVITEDATWKNLIDGAPDLTFAHSTHAYGYTVPETVSSYWTDNAHFFNFSSYAIMDQALDFGTNGKETTIQFVSSFNTSCYSPHPNHRTYFLDNGSLYDGFYATRTISPDRTVVQWTPGNLSSLWSSNIEWEGTYLTAIATSGDEGSFYFFAGVDRDGGSKKGANTSYEVDDEKWAIGSQVNGSPGTYSITGKVHSVRIYNRPLTNVELLLNRNVDEWRFHQRGNVLVATEVPGAEGTEASGEHCVNGTWEFSQPNFVAVGKRCYESNGYVLDVWQQGKWVPVETNLTSTTFAYTNCVARPRVRITWRWTQVGRLFSEKPDADDYEQDGLRTHFDAIENAGYGVARNTDPTATWVNLVNGAPNLEYAAIEENGAGEWTETAYSFNGKSYMKMLSALKWVNNNGEFTFQFALSDVEVYGTSRTSGPCIMKYKVNNAASYDGYEGFYLFKSAGKEYAGWGLGVSWGSEMHGYNGANASGAAPAALAWDGRYITGMADYSNLYYFQGTTKENGKAKHSAGANLSDYTWSLGARYDHTTSSVLTGKVHSVRIYNRALSDEELKRNRLIDDIRFFGGALETTNVVVQTSPKTLTEVASQNGIFEVMDSKWLFKALPATIDGKAGVVPKSYTIEERDANGNWVAKTEHEGAEYLYTVGESPATVRLTWRYGSQGLRIIVR